MFGSQTLEVAIGLVLVFFLLAAAASSVVEAIAALFKKRATDLESALESMLGGNAPALRDIPQKVADTTVFKLIAPKAKRGPSYLSAKAFADSVVEIVIKAKDATTSAEELYKSLPVNLSDWLEPVVKEVGADATAIKARLESWFDDRMARLQGSYKRWAQVWLFAVGLALVVATNASAYRMAAMLYADPAVSSAVTQAATATTTSSGTSANDIAKVADTVSRIDSLGLPVGWHNWSEPGGVPGAVGGWLATALLIMLGAPFWFDLLTKLVSLRSAGDKPPKAAEDPRSATAALTQSVVPAVRAVAGSHGTSWKDDLRGAF
jgi:hypothetical protein